MVKKKEAVAVFLKEPVPGKVKTRLARTVGDEAAASLYRSFAIDTLEWFGRLRGPEKFLYFSPRGAEEACADLAPSTAGLRLRPQSSGSLGHRLARAFAELLARRGTLAVVVGTDCPLLDGRVVRRALRALRDRDLVLGPARDGGYYLIGLSRPAPALFEGISWSTSTVLDETLRRADGEGLSSVLLEPLRDIDRAEDLEGLRRELVEAWREVAARRRADFPRRTFRSIVWDLSQASRR